VNRAAPSQSRERKAPLPRPSPSPRAHRRQSLSQSSATSPRTAPSQPPLAKSSLPLGSPAPAHAKPPPRASRTEPPVANRHRAHWRPVRPRRQAATPFSPSALADGWARSDAVAPCTRAVSLARGPQLGRKRAPARALAPRWAKNLSPGPAEKKSLFFSSPFSHLISFLQYFMHQKLSK
jgi:hypothetical protein